MANGLATINMTLHVGSLFSGIGGIDLGLERAGMTVKWQSEIDPYSCRVLKKHWPDVPNLGDIKNIDWKKVEVVDVIAGGYPCQPFSTAGKRNGTADPRHLWPEMLRAISTIRPRIAFLENVRGHYSLGFDSVLADLTEIGYDAQWETISALSVGAPHLRQRLICLAYPNGIRQSLQIDGEQSSITQFASNGSKRRINNNLAYPNGTPRQQQQKRQIQESDIGRCSQDVAYPNDTGGGAPRYETDTQQQEEIKKRQGQPQSQPGRLSEVLADPQEQFSYGEPDNSRDSKRSKKVSKFRDSGGPADVSRGWWEVEPSVGRVAHGVPFRVDRLRGLGNAVVPQVAETVGRIIHQLLT